MVTDLEIVLVEGEHRLDSRLLALRLGYEHKALSRAIQRNKVRLETKSFLRQIDEKTTRDSKGRGRQEAYYLLTERQCIILTGSLKKGNEALEWQDALIDAFLHARNRVRELEAHQQQSALKPTIHMLTDALRPRALENLNSVPEGYFSVMGELYTAFQHPLCACTQQSAGAGYGLGAPQLFAMCGASLAYRQMAEYASRWRKV